MAQAFSNLKVLDFTTTIAGPHCTRMMADLGAEVVKVESDDGDMMRIRPPVRNDASALFGLLNAGKKSVKLDLKSEEARDAVRKLVKQSDVVVENFRPGVMKRFGFDYDAFAKINPRLIYCSISGYGQTGPAADQPAYAPTIHAASGFDLAHMSYQANRARPDYCGVFIADILGGTYAFGAIGAALHQRVSTGRGQYIDLSMLECMLSLTLNEQTGAQFQLPPPPKRPVFGPVATADGYIMLAVASEKTFQALARAAGREDWIADPRYAQYLSRRSHWGELMDEFEAWSKGASSAVVLARLAEAGVPASPYRTVREALADPQIAHRQALAQVTDSGGTFNVLNVPFRMSGSVLRPGPRVAALGEHTDEVLSRLD
jgi:crotonobetainyl-CoA:carnitine CoA-transferase CaiB-like acyl-CoA transferase